MTIEEAAQLLGVSVDKAYDLYHEGKLPCPPKDFMGRRMVVLKLPLLRLLGVEIDDLYRLLSVVDETNFQSGHFVRSWVDRAARNAARAGGDSGAA